jgi:hypothetical protein
MSGTTSAADIMSLAWACYREPLRIQGKFQGNARLPDGLSHLLKVAAGDDSQMETLRAATGASATQLREAAIFFVKQVFFSRDANHYRVLGVNSDASIDQIKEHHRLLMHLFHPDRARSEESWEDAYANRINQSYSVLRKSESRQQYDAALKITAQQKSIPLPVRQRHYYFTQSQVGKSDSAGIRPPLVVARNLPQFVMGGLAVLAFSVIYLVYLPGAGDVALTRQEKPAVREKNAALSEETLARADNHLNLQPPAKLGAPEAAAQQQVIRVIKTQGVETAVTEGTLPAVPVVHNPPAVPQKGVASQYATATLPDLQPVKNVRLADAPGPSPKLEPALPETHRKPELKLASQARPVVGVADAASSHKIEKAAVTRAVLKVAATAPTPVLPVTATPPIAAVVRIMEAPPVVSAPAKVGPAPVVSASISPAISDEELDSLLRRFVTSYEQGDLESYVALFDDQARTSDKNGKVAIRKDYETLFSSSQGRQISLNNIRWIREEDSARGDGRFALRIRAKNDREFKAYSGMVRFELVKLENKLLIKGFFYDLDPTR